MSIETLKAANAALQRENDELQREVAELKAANATMQDQVKMMDAIFNSISDGVTVANKKGEFLFFNPIAEEIIGIGSTTEPLEKWSETYGIFYSDKVTPMPSTELSMYKAIHGERTNGAEVFVRNVHRPNGVFLSVSGRPLYDETGELIGGVVAFRDITQLKQTNDQLTIQTRLLHTIFHSISDGIVVAGETSNIIMANADAKRILGPIPYLKSSDEWFKPGLYFYPDRVTPFPMEEHPLFQAIWGKSTDGVEMFIRAEETEEGVYARVSGRPMQDNEGNWRGGVAVFHDMTERVKIEEAVAQAFAQGRLEIVDTILHNIGNAINSVDVGIDTIHHQLMSDRLMPRLTALAQAIEAHQDDFSDYVKNDPQGQKIAPFIITLATDFNAVNQELQQTVQRVKDRSRHIVDIIRTQNSYQDTSGTRKDINLADAISDAIKILQDSIDKRHIQITIDCEQAPEEIRIQESQFHQMLVNLIKNAVEAIDAVEATGERTEAPCIACRAYTKDNFLCFDITDNGIGIPQEDLKRIFAAGFTTKAYGSGLGLHSSANFVISSGGKIEAFSDGKGKGTTIRTMFRQTSV